MASFCDLRDDFSTDSTDFCKWLMSKVACPLEEEEILLGDPPPPPPWSLFCDELLLCLRPLIFTATAQPDNFLPVEGSVLGVNTS